MKPIAQTPETLAMARRCVWFQPPEHALANPEHLIGHVLTYGSPSNVGALRRFVNDADLCHALERASAGVIDRRSWAHWHLMLFGRRTAPPMPGRTLIRGRSG